MSQDSPVASRADIRQPPTAALAELNAFRVALANALRPLATPELIQAAAAKLLGEWLGASRALYVEVEHEADSDYYVIRQDYCAPGVPTLVGRHRADDFGATLFNEMRAGRTLAVANTITEPRLTDLERQAYPTIGIQAYVGVPLIKGGRHVALISVLQTTPRLWRAEEIALVEETAEYTWATVERARAETALRESEEQYRSLFTESARQRRLYEAILNNTPDLAYIFDHQHRFVYANEGLLRMWGKTWKEAIGKTCLELGYEPWHAEMHSREIDQVIATGQPLRGEVPFTGTFGRRIYDYIFVPVLGPHGEVEAVAGTTRDVTDRKEADRRKDEFLATLAHELRNPLAPIRSSIHVLSLSTQGNSDLERVCEMMERQVTHMVRLVDDLLEISRITRGVFELRKEQTTLATILRTAIDSSQPAITAAGHQLQVSWPPEAVSIVGDSVRLAQVVSNLLNNAAKYTDRGGQIWLSAEQTGDEVIIRVRDNGIGIPAEMLPLVFDMFMQVDRSPSRTQGGLGIGLTLVKRLVEMHGGQVSVSSPGSRQGSEFTVRLPYTAPAGTARAAVTPAVLPTKRRLLVVDDNVDAATSLGMIMRLLGSEVEVAHDGAAALAAMQSFRPQVVLLDLGMPGMDGFEVARQARQIAGLERVVLVALTGWGQDSDRERTRAAGFDHHLVKPTPVPELQALLAGLG